jgi:hypothetical protein
MEKQDLISHGIMHQARVNLKHHSKLYTKYNAEKILTYHAHLKSKNIQFIDDT